MSGRTTQRCWKCGKVDHSMEQCSASSKLCFNCQEPGHMLASCPKPRGILKRRCKRCNAKGHTTRECTNKAEWHCENCAGSGHGRWECSKPRGYLTMVCHRCEETGHIARECTKRRKCPNCAEMGHLKAECPKPHGFLRMKCNGCGEVGHKITTCPHRKCSSCGQPGHEKWACTNPPRSRAVCFLCGSTDHNTEMCSSTPLGKQYSQTETQPPPYYSGTPTAGPGSLPKYSGPNKSPPPQTRPSKTTNKGKADAKMGNDTPDSSSSSQENSNGAKAVLVNKRGAAAYASEEFQSAIELFSEAISLDPTVASYFTNRGAAYAKTGQYAVALGDFELAASMKTYKAKAKVLIHAARCRLCLGSLSTAMLALRDALSLEPYNVNAKALKRKVLELQESLSTYENARSRKHWHSAKQAYNSCLIIYGDLEMDVPVEVQCWSIESLITVGNWPAALQSVRDVLSKKPRATEIMVLHAIALFFSASVSEALSKLVEVLKLDPDNSRAKTMRTRFKEVKAFNEAGNNMFHSRDWGGAVDQWTSALQVIGENEEEGRGGVIRADVLLDKGIALGKLNQYSEALKDITSSLTLRPKNAKALHARGRIYVSLELYESALEDLRDSLQNVVFSQNMDPSEITLEINEAEQLERAFHEAKDHYKILGIFRGCSAGEIKKAYRRECLKNHPDKGGIPEKFKLIAEAYNILSDVESRASYDASSSRSQPDFKSRASYDASSSRSQPDFKFGSFYDDEYGW